MKQALVRQARDREQEHSHFEGAHLSTAARNSSMPLGLHRAGILQVVKKTLAHVLLSCDCCHVPIGTSWLPGRHLFLFLFCDLPFSSPHFKVLQPQCYVLVSGRESLGSITLLTLFYFILSNFLFIYYLFCTKIEYPLPRPTMSERLQPLHTDPSFYRAPELSSHQAQGRHQVKNLSPVTPLSRDLSSFASQMKGTLNQLR